MKSAPHGKPTSNVEVTNVSTRGLWLMINDREVFLPFEHFPWFKDAPIGELFKVTMPHPHHLYWPNLDIDLAVESIDRPDKYPLVSKVQLYKRTKATSRKRSR